MAPGTHQDTHPHPTQVTVDPISTFTVRSVSSENGPEPLRCSTNKECLAGTARNEAGATSSDEPRQAGMSSGMRHLEYSGSDMACGTLQQVVCKHVWQLLFAGFAFLIPAQNTKHANGHRHPESHRTRGAEVQTAAESTTTTTTRCVFYSARSRQTAMCANPSVGLAVLRRTPGLTII